MDETHMDEPGMDETRMDVPQTDETVMDVPAGETVMDVPPADATVKDVHRMAGGRSGAAAGAGMAEVAPGGAGAAGTGTGPTGIGDVGTEPTMAATGGTGTAGTGAAGTGPTEMEPKRQSGKSTDDVTLRFGPGVPAAVAEAWHADRRRRRPLVRRLVSALLTVALAVLTGLVVWWLLRGGGPAVQVTAVTVQAPQNLQGCDSTVNLVGTIKTNGGHGRISYRWDRSDGQQSDVFTENVHKGQNSLDVPLRWKVEGTGRLHAVATLRILEPQSTVTSGSAAFDYSCG